MIKEERKYYTYIADDGREFDSEKKCVEYEEDNRLRSLLSFKIDSSLLEEYKEENWEHFKHYIFQNCHVYQPFFDGVFNRDERDFYNDNENYKLSPLYLHPTLHQAIDSPEKLKDFLYNLFIKRDFPKVNCENGYMDYTKQISDGSKLYIDLELYELRRRKNMRISSYFGSTALNMYLLFFYNKNSILNEYLEEGESLVRYFLNAIDKGITDERLLKIDIPKNYINKIIISNITDRNNYKNNLKKYTSEILYPDGNKLENKHRCIYYTSKEANLFIEKVLDSNIKTAQDLEYLMDGAISRIGAYRVETRDFSLIDYLKKYGENKSIQTYYSDKSLREIYDFFDNINARYSRKVVLSNLGNEFAYKYTCTLTDNSRDIEEKLDLILPYLTDEQVGEVCVKFPTKLKGDYIKLAKEKLAKKLDSIRANNTVYEIGYIKHEIILTIQNDVVKKKFLTEIISNNLYLRVNNLVSYEAKVESVVFKKKFEKATKIPKGSSIKVNLKSYEEIK